MKYLVIVVFTIFLVIGCKTDKNKKSEEEHKHHDAAVEKVESTKKKPLSPHTYAMAMVGDAHIHIDYSSPGVRNRMIFGGLLAYDEIWQAGAHMATWLETNKDLTIDGKVLPAGKYGFFVIPTQGEWTVIFNTNWEQHGKDEYDIKDDVLRFKVNPVISDEITEHLVYKVLRKGENKGEISMAWEKVSIQFPFNVEE